MSETRRECPRVEYAVSQRGRGFTDHGSAAMESARRAAEKKHAEAVEELDAIEARLAALRKKLERP